MDTNQQLDFAGWLKKLNSGESLGLSLWQEAMEQIRQLHSDIWNGVIFFFTVNGILTAATFAIAEDTGANSMPWGLVLILAIIGLIVTLAGLNVFKKHRDCYVQMLLRKTLIERELGFYDVAVSGVDLTFPWKVDKEYVPELVRDPEKWKRDQRFRKGTISRQLLYVYYLFIIGYIIAFILALMNYKK